MNHHSGCDKNNKKEQFGELLAGASVEQNEIIELGKKIGPDNLTIVMEMFGGLKKHIPTVENFSNELQRQKRNKEIVSKFRGDNINELSIEYGLEKREIRAIVHHSPRPKKQPINTSVLKCASVHYDRIKILARDLNAATIRDVVDAMFETAFDNPDYKEIIERKLQEKYSADALPPAA